MRTGLLEDIFSSNSCRSGLQYVSVFFSWGEQQHSGNGIVLHTKGNGVYWGGEKVQRREREENAFSEQMSFAEPAELISQTAAYPATALSFRKCLFSDRREKCCEKLRDNRKVRVGKARPPLSLSQHNNVA